jgi:uncharacterized protein (TIGR03437 family)
MLRCGLVLVAACSSSADMPAPHIAAIAPTSGASGALVTVYGDHFCQRPDTGNDDPLCPEIGTVEFGVVPGTLSMWSDASITAEVPALAPGAVTVIVVAAGRVSNGMTFTVE